MKTPVTVPGVGKIIGLDAPTIRLPKPERAEEGDKKKPPKKA